MLLLFSDLINAKINIKIITQQFNNKKIIKK